MDKIKKRSIYLKKKEEKERIREGFKEEKSSEEPLRSSSEKVQKEPWKNELKGYIEILQEEIERVMHQQL